MPVHWLAPLVVRARDADAQAVDDLLAQLRPLVYRWAWVRMGDADDVEDVTQQVLLRVQHRLHSFEGRSNLTTWLYRVTMNAAGQLERRRNILAVTPTINP